MLCVAVVARWWRHTKRNCTVMCHVCLALTPCRWCGCSTAGRSSCCWGAITLASRMCSRTCCLAFMLQVVSISNSMTWQPLLECRHICILNTPTRAALCSCAGGARAQRRDVAAAAGVPPWQPSGRACTGGSVPGGGGAAGGAGAAAGLYHCVARAIVQMHAHRPATVGMWACFCVLVGSGGAERHAGAAAGACLDV